MSTASYITDYASSSRSSRVLAQPRSYTQLHIVATLAEEDAPPSFILLDPTGARVLVRGPTSLALDADHRIGDGAFHGIAYVADWGAVLGQLEKRWDGRTEDGNEDHQEQVPRYRVKINSGFQLAARLSAARWTSVGQGIATFGSPDEIGIYSRTSDGSEWMDVFLGRGVAAIGDDHRVIIGTWGGKVLVYAPDGSASAGDASARSQVAIGEAVHDVSVTTAGTITLSKRATTTGVRLVTESAATWTAEVAFAAHQPPIDGAEGRVYVAGDGLAAIDRGIVTWSTPSVVPIRATAFANGMLAVCGGPGLQIVARDGSIIQQLMTNNGVPLVTPPAIGPDGSIWVATATHLCVAR